MLGYKGKWGSLSQPRKLGDKPRLMADPEYFSFVFPRCSLLPFPFVSSLRRVWGIGDQEVPLRRQDSARLEGFVADRRAEMEISYARKTSRRHDPALITTPALYELWGCRTQLVILWYAHTQESRVRACEYSCVFFIGFHFSH